MVFQKIIFFQKYSELTFRYVKTHLAGWNHDFECIFDFQFFDFSDFNMLVRFENTILPENFGQLLRKKHFSGRKNVSSKYDFASI